MTDLVGLMDQEIAQLERDIQALREAKAVLVRAQNAQTARANSTTPSRLNGSSQTNTAVRPRPRRAHERPADALRHAIGDQPGISRADLLDSLIGNVRTSGQNPRRALNGTLWYLMAKVNHVREEDGQLFLTPEGTRENGDHTD